MKNILIAVDDTKSSREIFDKYVYFCKCLNPELIILLYVEQFTGRSLLDEMVTEPELKTLKEYLEGSDYKDSLDRKAEKILGFYRQALEQQAIPAPTVRAVVKNGHPAEVILSTAKEEGADMIVIGSRGKRVSYLTMGSVSREVANMAEVPVLIVK